MIHGFLYAAMALGCVVGLTGSAVAMPQASDIVVTGKMQTREKIREQVKTYVRGVSATPVSGQFARWRDAVCPKAIGISPENAAVVTEKIISVARAAGVKVAKAKCRTNLLVVFTDNADRDLADLRKKGVRAFAKLDPVERRLLGEAGRPARWWYMTAIEGIDGHKPTGSPAGLLNAQIEGGGAGFISNGDTVGIDGYTSSLIGTRLRSTIEQATFMIDANAATGRTLKAVAGFAALVTLARIRMDGATAADDSILRLFTNNAAVPQDLTARDAAFLSALYSVSPSRDTRAQERQIAAAMADRLSAPATR